MGKLEESANQQLQTEFEASRLETMKNLIIDRERAEKNLDNIKKRIVEVENADTRGKWNDLPRYSAERY